jgi:hypothetical protein
VNLAHKIPALRCWRFAAETLDAAASFVKEIHRISSPSARSHGWLPSLSKRISLNRYHHLLTTFWGWRDKQLPDGQ